MEGVLVQAELLGVPALGPELHHAGGPVAHQRHGVEHHLATRLQQGPCTICVSGISGFGANIL